MVHHSSPRVLLVFAFGWLSSQSRHTRSNQPSPHWKPKVIRVCLTSPHMSNHVGHRSTSFRSSSSRMAALPSRIDVNVDFFHGLPCSFCEPALVIGKSGSPWH